MYLAVEDLLPLFSPSHFGNTRPFILSAVDRREREALNPHPDCTLSRTPDQNSTQESCSRCRIVRRAISFRDLRESQQTLFCPVHRDRERDRLVGFPLPRDRSAAV